MLTPIGMPSLLTPRDVHLVELSRQASSAGWAGPTTWQSSRPLASPACSLRSASGMEPSSTPATQPGPLQQLWRGSRPTARPVCSLTWAGPTRTLPPARQRSQGDPHLGGAHAHWHPRLLAGSGRPNPAPHWQNGSATAEARRRLGQVSMPRTQLLVVPLPISTGVLGPLPWPLGWPIGAAGVAFNGGTSIEQALRVRANPIQSNPSKWLLLGVF
jgi:hypothetical protein